VREKEEEKKKIHQSHTFGLPPTHALPEVRS
jgi:hypothetical protein